MLPGIITQVSLDWDAAINYYLPTIKRRENKLYAWLRPNGPKLGGVKTPGTEDGAEYWLLLDWIVKERVETEQDVTDWNEMIVDGRFMMRTKKDVTANGPMNITGWWWLRVSTAFVNGTLEVLQEARLHSSEPDTPDSTAAILARTRRNGEWGDWRYDYAGYGV